mgnify:CR=1 FL=1
MNSKLSKKEESKLNKYLLVKDKYQKQEDLLKELKQRLEDCWSGASQVIEELEEFYYDTVNDKRLNERTRESLEQFFDYQLADIKDKAMDIQDETQNSIDNFVEQFNLNEEV